MKEFSCVSDLVQNPPTKLPVTFIGFQETSDGIKKLALVNQPDGSTVIFNPERHEIMNRGNLRLRARGLYGQYLRERTRRILGNRSNIQKSERKREYRIGKKEAPLGR